MRHPPGEHNHPHDGLHELLRILTLNLHKGFSYFGRRFVLPELRDAIRDISADVVFLQEVLGEHEIHANRHANWPDVAQYEFLADTIWHNYAYGKNAVYPNGHHGNALLSKYPILDYENRDISEVGAENRGLLHARVDAPGFGGALHVICAHLGLSARHRTEQLAKLAGIVSGEIPHDAAVVVAGDFNDWRVRANGILAEGANLEEAFTNGTGKPAKTYPARLPLLRLDRIYTRNVDVREPRILSHRPCSHLSDHAALVAGIVPA
jgi:endonuclease/exonuclease/phosphatase family metal-dependent hydrolase